MSNAFSIPKEHTDKLRACVIFLAAAYDHLTAYAHRNVEELIQGTSVEVGALVVLDCAKTALPYLKPQHVQRVMFCRRGEKLFDQELPAIDFGDGAVLTNLLRSSFESIPRDCFLALGFSGHGTGLFGSLGGGEANLKKAIEKSGLDLSDRTSAPHSRWGFTSLYSPLMLKMDLDKSAVVEPDFAKGSIATIFEIRDAIKNALESTERERVDVLFTDACVDAAIEFWIELAPFTKFYVASELCEVLKGWPYREWLASVQSTRDPSDWAKAAVSAYKASKEKTPEKTYSLSALGDPKDVIERLDAWSKAILADKEATRALKRAYPSVDVHGAHDLVALARKLDEDPDVSALVRDEGKKLVEAFEGARLDFATNAGRPFQGASLFVPRGSFNDPLRARHAELRLSKETQWDDLLRTLYR